MPIRVILLGEESVALSERITALPAAFDLHVVGAHADHSAAAHALRTLSADIALVSAELRDSSGFDLVASIPSQSRPRAIIFLSSREEDAVRAFELQATDFVPLPLHDARFHDAMIRARQQVLQAALLRTADELQRLLGEVVTVDELRDGGARAPQRSAVSGGFATSSNGAQHGASATLVASRGTTRGNANAASWDATSDEPMLVSANRDQAWRASRASLGSTAVRHGRDEETVLDLSAMPTATGVGAQSSEGRPLRVLVREGRRTRFVPLSEVDWFEADGNYIVVHAGVQTYRTRGTVSAIEAVLDPRQFVRIHRRMVVNMDRVREMSPLPGGDGLLMLGDGSTLRLSRTYRSRVR